MTRNNDITNRGEDSGLNGSEGVLGEDPGISIRDVYKNDLRVNKGRDLVDRVEIEYSGARRARTINLGKMDLTDAEECYGVGAEGITMGGCEGEIASAVGDADIKGDKEMISTIWMDVENDVGWQPYVKDKIKEKTGKWERFLLKGNLGRRWIERTKEDGTIPRQIGHFVDSFRVMEKDQEVAAGMTAKDYVSLIAGASLRSGYRFKVRKNKLEKEMTKATDDEIEIDLDLDDLVVHLWKCNTPGIAKHMTFSNFLQFTLLFRSRNCRKTGVQCFIDVFQLHGYSLVVSANG